MTPPHHIRCGMFRDRFGAELEFTPTPCQSNLLDNIAEFICSDETVMVVNGYAGTGKTTALSAVIRALPDLGIHRVLMAPTGRAAKVLSHYSGSPAGTIHKCIYRQKSFSENGAGKFDLAPNKDKDTLYIVDEVSLIGSLDGGESLFGSGDLLRDLLAYVEKGRDCKVILVGDSAQLPPVGLDRSPALDPDIMGLNGAARFCTLTTVVRQAGECSLIVENATRLRELITEGYPVERDELALNAGEGLEVQSISGAELIDALSDAYSRYGEDETVVLCRSNKRANRYNAGIRSSVLFKEERLCRGDKLMVVKNNYHFVEGKLKGLDFVANGEIVRLEKIHHFEERYGLEYADAILSLPDYDDQQFNAKVILDTLTSETASLSYEQQNELYRQVNEDYAHIKGKQKRYEAVREDPYFAAIQLKYAEAITTHKSQGGQWDCVFVDNPFWQDVPLELQDLKWLYTAITRAVKKVYLVNFDKSCFN